MPITIQLRRGTASEWSTANSILASGEIGLETDTNRLKIGDGATVWASLTYYGIKLVSNAGTGPGTMIAGEHLVYKDTSGGGHSYMVFCDGTNRYGHSEDLTLHPVWSGLS
jgi:hypothetical protein